MIKNNISISGIPIENLKPQSRKLVIKICDICKIEKPVKYADLNQSRKNRNSNIDYCKLCAKILYSGENNPSKRQEVREKISQAHKGKGKNFIANDGFNSQIVFRKVDSNGYILVYDLIKDKYIQEHRYNYEQFLQRPLKNYEQIHHIDGNKQNNKVSNLQLCDSISVHNHIHSNLEQQSFELVKKGILIFDKEKNEYLFNKIYQVYEGSLGFEHIAIKQKKNICNSRLDVYTKSEIFRNFQVDIPMIASNMSTVINSDFLIKIIKNGAFGFLHRALNDEVYIKEVLKVSNESEYVPVSIGIGLSQYELSKKLINNGANIVLIDIAHGYSDEVINLGRKIKKEYPHIKMIVGNTTNVDMMQEVDDFADAVKVGIGQGFACETKNTAGCTEKQFSCNLKFKEISKQLGLPIISDGGIREPADFVKAVASGANSVMAGSIFAACPESASELIEGKKLYAGMASEYVQNQWKGGLKSGTCSEGGIRHLDLGLPLEQLLERYQGALRSGITYSGANTLQMFQDVVEFIRIV